MSEVLHLYHSLLRQASKLASYNFRQYALRRVRDGFLSNRSLTDRREIQKELAIGRQQLEVLKRQAAISQMYTQQKLVIETQKVDKTLALEN
jgi:LYR motif-containing protein 4